MRNKSVPSLSAPRAEERRRTLLRPQSSSLDAQAVERRCLKTLSKLVWDTANWKWEDYGVGWKIGDFNFLILESTVAPEAILYAQLWSEPMESVLFEVCSGELNPGARRYVDEAARHRLQEMGFTLPGASTNFRKVITIASPADAEVAAVEMLRVFSEVFGYTARAPLTARLVRDERAGRAVVHSSLTPEDVKKLLDAAGYDATLTEGTSTPMIQVRRRGFTATVFCDGRVGGSNLYTAFDALSIFERPSETQREALASLATRYRFIRGQQDADGDVSLGASLGTDGGVTTEAIAAFFTNFEAVVRDIRRKLQRQNPASRQRARLGARAPVVH